MGCTWCGGSGYVLRRTALDTIGGFPTESVGEDMHCSNVLLGKGWDAIYVDEVLQTGRVPESYRAHVKQQSRWVSNKSANTHPRYTAADKSGGTKHVGRVQTAMAMRFYLYGEASKKMGLRQRLIGLIYVIVSLCNILTTVAMATLIMSLASSRYLIVYQTKAEFKILTQLTCAAFISEWLDDCVVGLITGYRIAISEGHVNYWIAPCKT